jgi:outer membrane autotransporter protein
LPIWSGFFPGNWSKFPGPGAGDTAVFPANFTPSFFDSLIGANPNGSQVFLVSGFLPPVSLPHGSELPFSISPTAGNLVFLNSWTLTAAVPSFFLSPSENPRRGFDPFSAFSPATLTLTQGTITVGAQATATIDANINVTSGQLTKMGPGTLRFEETVNGNILVEEGTLGGNFTVLGNLVNMATLSPGNSPGTIIVGGNFQQVKGGTLNIEVASPSAFDQLLVTGKAKLGGNLDVSLLDGFTPKKGAKFTIISAGKVSGEFNSVDAPVWDLLTLRPFYGRHTVTLEAVINSFDALPGLTPNQHAVAQNLDKIIFDPRAAGLLNFLYGRDLSDLPRQFDRIAPEELTSIFTMGMSLSNMQSLNLQQRADNIRSGINGFSAQGFSLSGAAPSYSGNFDIGGGVAGPNGDDGKEVKETKEVVPHENRWGAFVTGTGQWVNVSSTDNARGYDLTSGGFTLGVDYKVCPNFAIGIAAGYTGTSADLTDHGRVWVNGGKFGLYATTFAGGWYADVAAFGGYNSYDTRRSAIQGDARGDTDGGEVDALFGTGYDFKSGGFTFGPTASFNYTYVGMNGFTENGSLSPLNIHGGNADSLRTAFGAKVSYDCKCHGVIIRPELRVAWQHEYGDTTYNLASSFANGAGGAFTTAGPRLGRDSVLVGAGFAVLFNDRCSTYIYYDGELGRENYESNAVTGGFRIAF